MSLRSFTVYDIFQRNAERMGRCRRREGVVRGKTTEQCEIYIDPFAARLQREPGARHIRLQVPSTNIGRPGESERNNLPPEAVRDHAEDHR